MKEADEFITGLVIIEHKERYVVQTEQGIFDAEITGNLRYSAASRRDFPVVGDKVGLIMMDDANAIIMKILPRTSILERQAVGMQGGVQLIAANIDHAFIVQAVGHDFNLNRLERYLVLCHNGGIDPIIILNKTDLVKKEEALELVNEIKDRIKGVRVLPLSSETKEGLDQLRTLMKPGESYCFLGSSGVGKSTLINLLSGKESLKTNAVSVSTNKGKHTTSHRELIKLPDGSIVIDTAGMREIGMTASDEGLEQTFDEISTLSASCRFSDCSHSNEAGCAVLEALRLGNLSTGLYENYQKLKREQLHFSSTVAEKRQKDKEFGKLIKSVMKEKKKF